MSLSNIPVSKEQLIQQIQAIGINSTDTLLVHSSMKAVGAVENGVDGVLDAFEAAVADGLLLFPTHTWSDSNNPGNLFDVVNEPSCVGILTETFRKRKGVIRSMHPTHSIAGKGKRAADFLKDEEKTSTPCPRNGCWGRLYDWNAKILFLGASTKTNTYLHGVEEWHNIPDRLAEQPTPFTILTRYGQQLACPQHRHFSSFGDVSKNFDKIEAEILENGIATRGLIGSAHSICMEAAPLADYVGELLKTNPSLFNDDRPLNG